MDVDNGAHETETGASSESLLIHYWYVLRRRRGVVVAFTAFLMLSVGIATSLSTPYYAATAVIEISPKVDTPFEVDRVSEFVSASSSSELRNYYATQYKIMQSRSVARLALAHLPDAEGVHACRDGAEVGGVGELAEVVLHRVRVLSGGGFLVRSPRRGASHAAGGRGAGRWPLSVLLARRERGWPSSTPP